jgi:prolipoprotein diacylglyceryltransferase
MAFYLIGYGAVRMMLEIIRNERVVGFGMTLAQWGMMVFIVAGIALLAVIFFHNHHAQRHRTHE